MEYFKYTLIGDKGTCPDMIQMHANGDQFCIYRAPDENVTQFWERVVSKAKKLAKRQKGRAPRTVHDSLWMVMFCHYGVPYLDKKAAKKHDDLTNYVNALRRTMKDDPSYTVRVKAARMLADVLWPELRERTH